MSLVLWFKGTVERHSAPIYTIDARQRPLSNGARHFVADNYKGRAKFVAKASPPYLDLAPLEADDQAEYRCRIDYRSRPRENFLIILFVLGKSNKSNFAFLFPNSSNLVVALSFVKRNESVRYKTNANLTAGSH